MRALTVATLAGTMLCSIASPMLAAPRPVAAAPVAATSFSISGPSVASSNGGFLATWHVDTFVGHRIDGMPVDALGRRMQGQARPLVAGAMSATVLPSGDHFLLTYSDSRSLRHFRPVATDGSVLSDTRSLPIFANASRVVGSADGKRVLVLRFEPGQITGVLLDEAGVIIRSGIYIAANTTELFAVIAAGDGFLVLTQGADGLRLQRLSGDGIPAGDSIHLETAPGAFGSFGAAAAATAGDTSLVFWTPAAPGQPMAMAGAFITHDGVVKPISVPRSAGISMAPRKLFWTGDKFILILSIGRNFETEWIGMMRFDRDGQPLDPEPVIISRESGTPRTIYSDAASNGTILYVTAIQPTILGTRVLGISVPLDAAMGGPREEVLSLLPARQNAVSAASSPSTTLTSWREAGVEGQSIRFALLMNGIPSEPITLTTVAGFIGEPVVAYGDGVFLIAWEFFHQLLAVRVTAGGVLLDAVPLTIAASDLASFGKPAVAWNGTQFLVAWSGFPLRGAFVSAAGVVSQPRDLTLPGEGGSEPALAWNGDRFVLAHTIFFGSPFPGGTSTEVRAVALRGDGSNEGSSSHVLITDGMRPAIATGGREFFVVAERWGTLQGVWLEPSGVRAGDSFPITRSGWISRDASLAWTGQAYAVAAHGRIAAGWQLRVMFVASLARGRFAEVGVWSRPDLHGGMSAAVATGGEAPLVFFSDVRDDEASGGSSRLMFERMFDLPQLLRRRAAGR